MNVRQKLKLFQELISCDNQIYTWCYDTKGNVEKSNCIDESALAMLFRRHCPAEQLLSLAGDRRPLLMGCPLGLVWGIDFEYEDDSCKYIRVIGPVFFSEICKDNIMRMLDTYDHNSKHFRYLCRFLCVPAFLPVISRSQFSSYLLILHYCLTGEKLEVDDIKTPNLPTDSEDFLKQNQSHAEDLWEVEHTLMELVKNGDINYQDILTDYYILWDVILPRHEVLPLRRAKNTLLSFLAMICRAALEGGLSPASAYALEKSYAQTVEDAVTSAELSVFPRQIFEDFLTKVHEYGNQNSNKVDEAEEETEGLEETSPEETDPTEGETDDEDVESDEEFYRLLDITDLL